MYMYICTCIEAEIIPISFSSIMDIRKEFLSYLQQPEQCELFYHYMKQEHLANLLEFYLACDAVKNSFTERKTPDAIIELIYKHYLAHRHSLSLIRQCSLPDDLLVSIQQRLARREYHSTFYDQAQEHVFKYMLQMCFPKFLVEQRNRPSTKRQALGISTFAPMYRRSKSTKKKPVADKHTSPFGTFK
jgi:hypothetical protein